LKPLQCPIEYYAEEREDEKIQQVEILCELPRGRAGMAENGACTSRADKSKWWNSSRGERKEGIKKLPRGLLRLAAWIFIFLIIWTQLFHCK
jgi:hypothetical protein